MRATVVLIMLLLTAGPVPAELKPGAIQLPEWLKNPAIDGGIGAVGYGLAENGSLDKQRKAAASEARFDLAGQLQVRVLSNLTQGLTCYGEQCDAVVGQDVGNEILMTLDVMGMKKKAEWQHPQTGELFIWMVAEDIESILVMFE